MSALAFCDARGVIEFTTGALPDGMLPVYRARTMGGCREIISAAARHAHDGKTLLVPGIPEAVDDDAAVDALIMFRAWIKATRARGVS